MKCFESPIRNASMQTYLSRLIHNKELLAEWQINSITYKSCLIVLCITRSIFVYFVCNVKCNTAAIGDKLMNVNHDLDIAWMPLGLSVVVCIGSVCSTWNYHMICGNMISILLLNMVAFPLRNVTCRLVGQKVDHVFELIVGFVAIFIQMILRNKHFYWICNLYPGVSTYD